MRGAPSFTAATHILWDELADFPVTQTDAALMHLMKTVCGWLHADDALWIGGVRMMSGASGQRDPQHGWRGRIVRRLAPAPAPALVEKTQQAMREQDTDPGMTTRAITAEAGVFRVRRLRDGFVDFAAFCRTAHYRAHYEVTGIVDRLWAAFPVNENTESYFLFDHLHSKRRFSQADVARVAHALRGIKWFHRQLLLSHNLLLAQAPLSATQRRVLFALLSDRTEKQAAAELGLTPGTTHQYALELYRKFGVKGRAGLMALWLGR